MRMKTVLLLWGVGAQLMGCERTRIEPPTPTEDPRGGEGAACGASAECADGLRCGHAGRCAQAGSVGTTLPGEACGFTEECAIGGVCAADGQCAAPGDPGTIRRGAGCEVGVDVCERGSVCFDSVCVGFAMPLVGRPDCQTALIDGDEPADTFRVIFDPPPAQPLHEDFFRAPFPSDARVHFGDDLLTGMVDFGEVSSLGDAAGPIRARAITDFEGFGAQAAVFVRTSHVPDLDTVSFGLPYDDPGADGAGTVALVDLTPGPSFGQLQGMGARLRTFQPYHCDPWLAVSPAAGRPLAPGHSYGVFVTRGLRGPDTLENRTPTQSAALAAALADAPGSDVPAWQAFAPMRAWLDAEGVDPAHVVAASVFTVEDHTQAPVRLAQAVQSAPAPVAQQLHLCGDAPGPHADPADPRRGCHGAQAGLFEVQGTVQVPLIQPGAAPFVRAEDGGVAAWGPESVDVVGTQDVTFALTVPEGPAPAGGWPLVIFAHGADGTYRTAVDEGLAARWSALDGGAARFATLSIDTWLTGPRAGDVSPAWLELFPLGDAPDILYANPLHPAAARDNIAQSAVDWWATLRWLEQADFSAVDALLDDPVALDTGAVWAVGHGIGAAALPLLASDDARIRGIVLAAAGGSWADGLTGRQAPFPADGLLGPALGAPILDRYQPIVALGQQLVDRTDPLVHAPRVSRFAAQPRDVLHVVGRGDARVGDTPQWLLTRALYTDQIVQQGLEPLESVAVREGPVSANVAGSTAVTVVNLGDDPHRLLFDSVRTRAQVDGFLASALQDGRATVPSSP